MATKAARAKLFSTVARKPPDSPVSFGCLGPKWLFRGPQRGVLLESLGADFEARRRKFFELAGSCPDVPDVPPHFTPDIARAE